MSGNDFEQKIYLPQLISRRGEWTAWVLSVITFAAWILWRFFNLGYSGLATALLLFFGVSAILISFGNWMDRETEIRVFERGVAYKNGLRNVRLTWDEIQSVRVFPAQWDAKRIRVMGHNSRFDFRTSGEINYNGDVKGQTGFADGDEILQTILESTGMRMVENTAPNYYYYARE